MGLSKMAVNLKCLFCCNLCLSQSLTPRKVLPLLKCCISRCQARVSRSKAGINRDRLLKILYSPQQSLSGPLILVVKRFEIQVISVKATRVLFCKRVDPSAATFQSKCVNDSSRNLMLDRKCAIQRAVIGVRPCFIAIQDIDQLDRN